MKRFLCLLIALLLCPAALAEADGAALQLQEEETYRIDLDGDGTEETVQLRTEETEYGDCLCLSVEADGESYTQETYFSCDVFAEVLDLDGDGGKEILLCGDEASSDYITYCLQFDRENGLKCVPFANASRGEETQGYEDVGYGRIDAIEGNTLTMSGSQDVLGTWWLSREFTLRDGRFELDDGGIWREAKEDSKSDTWEYHFLTVKRELAATGADGAPITLSVGEKLVVTETDRQTFASFRTQSGTTGTLSISPDAETGWTFLVNGEKEETYFSTIPYAD